MRVAQRRTEKQRERARIRHEKEELRTARKAWDRLDTSYQEQLLRELIETRSREFYRAYPDLLEIGVGFATRRKKHKTTRKKSKARATRVTGAAKKRVIRRLHLLFVVKKKIDDAGDISDRVRRRFLPKQVFLYANVDGERVRCAVPTDVEARAENRFHTAATTNPRVNATCRRRPSVRGTVCCTVVHPADARQYFAIGCHHVFCLSKLHAGPPEDRRVLLEDGQVVLGNTTYLGILRGGRRYSLDAALAEYDEDAGLHQSPYLPRSGLFAQLPAGIPVGLRVKIRTPRPNRDNGLVVAQVIAAIPDCTLVQDYHGSYKDSRPIIHEELVKLRITSTWGTEGGDSGSPVFDADTNCFLGMHIAGQAPLTGRRTRLVRGEHTLMIPSYILLRAAEYGVPVPPHVFFELKT